MSGADCTPGREPRSVATSSVLFIATEANFSLLFKFLKNFLSVHVYRVRYRGNLIILSEKIPL